jgi:predicted permease
MTKLFSDLRSGIRQLTKNPTFTAVAVVTLALGIGANTAIFSILNTVLLRPLPFQAPENLVWIERKSEVDGGLSGSTSRSNTFKKWRETNQSFEDLGGYFAFFEYTDFTLTGNGDPERISSIGVTQSFLPVLGVPFLHGRNFDDEESRFNGRKAVILPYKTWHNRFNGNKDIIGQSITLNNAPYEVIGILPHSFDFASVFTPSSKIDLITVYPISDETDNYGNTLSIVGRTKPGVTIDQAQQEFNLLSQRMQDDDPDRGEIGATLSYLQDHIRGNFQKPMWVLFTAVGCVLLIACANLSNLLLTRSVSRKKELAVRMSLGAGKLRIITQMLTENFVLAACGAIIGLPLAIIITDYVSSAQSYNIPMLTFAKVDYTVLLFTLAVTLFTGILFSILPAMQLSTMNFNDNLKDTNRGSSEGKQNTWMRKSLVVTEVSMAFVLLICAGLMIHSFSKLLDVNLGFKPEQTFSWRIDPNQLTTDFNQRISAYENMVQSVEAIPGVESVGITDSLPLGRNRRWGVGAAGKVYAPGTYPDAFPHIIDHRYIQTMKIPLIAGRYFTANDTSDSGNVIIINESLARRLWQEFDTMNDVINQKIENNGEWRVVGVVSNVRHESVDKEGSPEMYFPVTQMNDYFSLDLVIRTTLPESTIVSVVRSELRKISPTLPTTEYQSLNRIVDQAVSPKWFIMTLISAFSLLALILASIGIYGVIAYSASSRTNEFGIRMALGANKSNILTLVISQGIQLVSLGIAIGIGVSLILTRVIQSLLYEVSPSDPYTYSTVTVLLMAVTFTACLIPSWWASRLNPMNALRYE